MFVASTLIAVACDAGPSADDGIDTSASPPTFVDVHEDVIAPRCVTTCHVVDADPPAGEHRLRLMDPDDAYAALVGVASTRCEGLVRVVPGDPEASLLWLKVAAGEPVCGFKMPPDCFDDTCGLAEGEAEIVHGWIAAGAPRR